MLYCILFSHTIFLCNFEIQVQLKTLHFIQLCHSKLKLQLILYNRRLAHNFLHLAWTENVQTFYMLWWYLSKQYLLSTMSITKDQYQNDKCPMFTIMDSVLKVVSLNLYQNMKLMVLSASGLMSVHILSWKFCKPLDCFCSTIFEVDLMVNVQQIQIYFAFLWNSMYLDHFCRFF